MPPSDYIRQLQKAIRAAHGCGSRHFTTIPVTETFRGKVAWQGEVEVFDLTGHPMARTCYAWRYDDNGTTRTIALLGLPPVDSAETAVKVAIASEGSGVKESRSGGRGGRQSADRITDVTVLRLSPMSF
jgi:hypothetical protein